MSSIRCLCLYVPVQIMEFRTFMTLVDSSRSHLLRIRRIFRPSSPKSSASTVSHAVIQRCSAYLMHGR